MKQLLTLSSLFLVLVLLSTVGMNQTQLVTAQSERAVTVQPNNAVSHVEVSDALPSSSVMFIENVGQFDDGARFQVRGATETMWLAEDALWITLVERRQSETPAPFGYGPHQADAEEEPLQGVNIKLSFVGANPAPRIEPFDRLDTHISYFVSNDSDQWQADVPVWGGVRYVDLYPGIDLEVSSEDGQWRPRIVLRDRSVALDTVRLRVEGADVLATDAGWLRLDTYVGSLSLPLPEAEFAIQVEGRTADGQQTTLVVPPARQRAIIRNSMLNNPADNPDELLYSTFLGGSPRYSDDANGIAVDGDGNAYITGSTQSLDFPTTPGAFSTNRTGRLDAFVVKLNPTGSDLVYGTFIGGEDNDDGQGVNSGRAIAIDEAGNAYVTGVTLSESFPTTSDAFDDLCGRVSPDDDCSSDAFV